MKLYEISEVYRDFIGAIEAEDFEPDVIANTLEAIEAEFEAKAVSVACIIKQLIAEAKELKAEQDALNKRRKAKEERAEWLRGYLMEQMRIMQRDAVEGPRARITVRLNPPAVFIADEDAFRAWAEEQREDLLTITAPTPNRRMIGEAMRGGEEIPYCELCRSTRLEIK